MNSEILELLHERDILLHNFKKNNNEDVYRNFCKLRNKVQRMVKKAKYIEYIGEQVQGNRNEPKNLWKHLKNMGYKNKPKEASVALNIDNKVCQDQNTIVNYLNKFFTTVAAKLVETMPTQKGIFNVTSSLFVNFYRKRNPNQYSFTLQTVSEDFVYKELSSLNITKSTGLDKYQHVLLKTGQLF